MIVSYYKVEGLARLFKTKKAALEEIKDITTDSSEYPASLDNAKPEKVTVDLDELTKEERSCESLREIFKTIQKKDTPEEIQWLWTHFDYFTKELPSVECLCNIIYWSIQRGETVVNHQYVARIYFPDDITFRYNPNNLSWTLYDGKKKFKTIELGYFFDNPLILVNGLGIYIYTRLASELLEYLGWEYKDNQDLPF